MRPHQPISSGVVRARLDELARNGGQRLYLLHGLDLAIAITCGNYDGEKQSQTPVTTQRAPSG
jgi:hypothetical protein